MHFHGCFIQALLMKRKKISQTDIVLCISMSNKSSTLDPKTYQIRLWQVGRCHQYQCFPFKYLHLDCHATRYLLKMQFMEMIKSIDSIKIATFSYQEYNDKSSNTSSWANKAVNLRYSTDLVPLMLLKLKFLPSSTQKKDTIPISLEEILNVAIQISLKQLCTWHEISEIQQANPVIVHSIKGRYFPRKISQRSRILKNTNQNTSNFRSFIVSYTNLT